MLAAHFDNWIFLLLVAMAALLRLLASKATGSKNQTDSEQEPKSPEQVNQPRPRATTTSDEEQIRKFLEALGQPATSKPPPPVTPRTDLPPRPVAPVRPPPVGFPISGSTVPTRTEQQKRGVVLPENVPAIPESQRRKIKLPGQIATPPYEKKTFTPQIPEPPTFEVREADPQPPEPPPPLQTTPAKAYAVASSPRQTSEKVKIDLALLLASPSGLRNAIILREIFGPPRSLQPLEEAPGTA
ncbi:MAG: hypothetical protein QOI34_1510 [Verrucomicrobiota bacterium]